MKLAVFKYLKIILYISLLDNISLTNEINTYVPICLKTYKRFTT